MVLRTSQFPSTTDLPRTETNKQKLTASSKLSDMPPPGVNEKKLTQSAKVEHIARDRAHSLECLAERVDNKNVPQRGGEALPTRAEARHPNRTHLAHPWSGVTCSRQSEAQDSRSHRTEGRIRQSASQDT